MRRNIRRAVVLGAVGATMSAVFVGCSMAAALLFGARRWTRRVVVEGRSMLPALEPGDRLLVVRLPRWWPLQPGAVVWLPDPRTPGRLLVKRVTSVTRTGVTVAGNNEEESTDSRTFGPVERTQVWGLALYRYAPAARAGRVGRYLHGARDSSSARTVRSVS